MKLVSRLTRLAIVCVDGECPPGPRPLTSKAYARDLNEVKALGSATSTVRTPDQTEAAIWWDDFRMVESEIMRQLASTQRLSTLETARMFAMADVAAIDALIPCYRAKKSWNLWRPVTAIPLADTDSNPATRRRSGLDAAAGHGAVTGVPLGDVHGERLGAAVARDVLRQEFGRRR
jgi:hypothetical protein